MRYKMFFVIVFLCMLGGICTISIVNPRYTVGRIIHTSNCALPLFVRDRQIVGVWETNYGSGDGQVTETISLNMDGSYAQTIGNGLSNVSSWELITDAPDSPKILLLDGVYPYRSTSGGIQANTVNERKLLFPQVLDVLEFSASDGTVSEEDYSITYPQTGYIYIYPRICYGELAIHGMRDRPIIDLDSQSFEGPLYNYKDIGAP